jgi:predicted GTPase
VKHAPWREIAVLIAVVAPLALLPALGVAWLWERGLMLAWLGVLLAVALLAWAARAAWSRQPHGIAAPPPAPSAGDAERRAHAALDAVLAHVGRDDIATTAALQALAERVLRAVAQAYYPGDANAVLRVTVPELLLMTERFAARLRARLVQQVPLLERAELKLVPQGVALRDGGTRLWRAWRVLRLADPIGALLQEARGVIVNAALSQLSDAARDRAAAIVARELGTVAIDLYAGRFRRAGDDLAETAPPLTPLPADGPVTVLLGGQRNAGKSSLVNALAHARRVPASLATATDTFTAHAIGDDLVVVDGPGTGAAPSREWLSRAAAADLILWVARAHDVARGPDQRALAALRDARTEAPTLSAAPVVLALTHADRLDPPRDWAPPYPTGDDRPKAASMRAALGAARAALDLDRAVILRCDHPETAWNLDALEAALREALPEARARRLDRAMARPGWGAVARRTVASLPGLARALWRRR